MDERAAISETPNIRANVLARRRGSHAGSAVEVDAWALAGLPGRVRFASYLTVRNSAPYRLIVDVLLEAQARSLTGVARVDLPRLLREHAAERYGEGVVEGLLREDALELDQKMTQLSKWGTVESWQDRAELETDFLRNRERYQLTQSAAELHRFVVAQEQAQHDTSTSVLLGPALIAKHVEEFCSAALGRDHETADTAWAQVQLTLSDMQRAAHRWQSAMAHGLSGAPSADKIESLTTLLRNYVDVWGASVDLHTPAIGALALRVTEVDADSWRAIALHRLGAEAPDDVLADAVRELTDASATLKVWFCGRDNESRRLRRQVRDAVPDVLRSHRTLLSVGGAVSRRAEVMALAGELERAEDDHAAWSLWQRATGLYQPVHLILSAPDAAPAGSSFWEAPPAAVDRRLRARGHQALKGTPGRIPDLSQARAVARSKAAQARRELAEAEEGVLRRSGQPLSMWGELTDAEGTLLWELLSTARAGTRHPDGSRSASTEDTRWQIRMLPAPEVASSAIIQLPEGVVVLDDVTLEFERG
ncbi:DUF2397 domain-containing protein [Streptomyces afghaniensis]|uniref:DUF2397 domain-containing protein n=1 Tax=Streptomyces afghaniensis TaxID=66865 RepID=UPI00277F63EC|nr:DUF2397 domain-containing protein [Streptomyces afghaniensis]MDQ1019869.1 uncharacterized protein (TIGR02677 family) [Streptomyces afghaniensis]